MRLLSKVRGRKRYVQARAVSKPLPSVPARMAAGIKRETPVDLRLKVDRDGRIRDLRIVSLQHAELAKLTADAAERWRFEPARFDGRPVASDVILHFRYHLP